VHKPLDFNKHVVKYRQFIKPLGSCDKRNEHVRSPVNLSRGGIKTSKSSANDKKMTTPGTFSTTPSSMKPKSGKKSHGHIRKPTKAIIPHISSHKKQNSLANYSIFKFLTSPRTTKNSNKIMSSRMEVINLNKDMKPKKKLRDKKVYSSVIDSDISSLIKKSSKRRPEKPGSSLLNFSNEAVGLPNKAPTAIQIKPKKFKKRLTMGGVHSSKGNYASLPTEIPTSRHRNTSRKSVILPKSHMKSYSIHNEVKMQKSAGKYLVVD
jgi:hypothetical protein